MKIIKYLIARKLIKSIDKSIKVKMGRALECEPVGKVVYLAFKTDKIDKETFADYVNELNDKCKFNTLLLGILHEVGHIFTYDENDEDEYTRDTELLSLLYKEKKLSARQLNEFYVRLPLERKATEWAIEFAMLNKKLCKYYQRKLGDE